MSAAIDRRLRQPAYARELLAARAAGASVNLYVHVGRTAWQRATRNYGSHRLVVPLDDEHSPADFDLTCARGLDVVVNAVDCDVALARQVAVRLCQHGARMAVLLHPALSDSAEFFYGVAP